MPIRTILAIATIPALLALTASGCRQTVDESITPPAEVVAYTALDREFSEPIYQDFEQESGVHVRPKFDVESTKTVGLTTAIIHEAQRPRCDVFWNNEILNTLRLAKLGLLDTYRAPNGADLPANYRSAEGLWHGFAARGRLLLVNTEKLPNREAWPTSIRDLADPTRRGQGGIARPLFGTTATHAAVLFATWGEQPATEFFQAVKENSSVESGNRQVSIAVGRGQLAFGLTDTDDAMLEIEAGNPVAVVFPDQGDEQMGTLFIPNTVAIIKNGPNPQAAQALVDYLLSHEVERRLATGPSAQIPVHPAVTERSRAMPDEPVKWMEADFEAAADQWETTANKMRDLFGG